MIVTTGEKVADRLPSLVAGPILRHCNTEQVTLWLVTTQAYQIKLTFKDHTSVYYDQVLSAESLSQVQVGKQAFINLISLTLTHHLPKDALIYYDIALLNEQSDPVYVLSKDDKELLYSGESLPSFAIKSTINELYHGSCRKPHFPSGDGLVQLDHQLTGQSFNADKRPAMLIMSGDQVYVDDVAGPMLSAVHQTIQLLGLFEETWQSDEQKNSLITSTQALLESEFSYYQRNKILPYNSVNPRLIDKLFGASKQPIFTSVNAKNHLVTLSEVLALYLLSWSPILWSRVDLSGNRINIPSAFRTLYQKEVLVIEDFTQGLVNVRRALAHIPVYMIFDDHDVTDDWNLTRGWEEAAYTHPFSKRIIGNALIGYYLCQGWGNAPDNFTLLNGHDPNYFTEQGVKNHDELINHMLEWDQWHYQLATTPKIVVLDTRTQRWRSESNPGKPSGLMDWESLSQLQQELIDQPCVIMVSAAPIYGLKMIETIQRVVTFLGKPLAVDAENWMAHKGTANVMLNIFRHHKTPPQFIILSGDVHYSFVYDVSHRFIRTSSSIVQITCSGIKNQFPDKLIHVFERLNRYFYGSYSPLNWFTKRRRMKIKVRKPSVKIDKTIYNGSGIGVLRLSDDFSEVDARIINEHGEVITFERSEETT